MDTETHCLLQVQTREIGMRQSERHGRTDGWKLHVTTLQHCDARINICRRRRRRRFVSSAMDDERPNKK